MEYSTYEAFRIQFQSDEQAARSLFDAFRKNALSGQVGGTHYAALKEYQPFVVLQKWMSAEAFEGYMKGNAITYLQRVKNGREDIEKAAHTLQAYLDLTASESLSV